MTGILKVVKPTEVKPKQWVVVRRGKYKNDFAKVVYVDMKQNEVLLKLLPRIDYMRLRGPLKAKTSDTNNKGEKIHKSRARPAAKPFDPEAIRCVETD